MQSAILVRRVDRRRGQLISPGCQVHTGSETGAGHVLVRENARWFQAPCHLTYLSTASSGPDTTIQHGDHSIGIGDASPSRSRSMRGFAQLSAFNLRPNRVFNASSGYFDHLVGVPSTDRSAAFSCRRHQLLGVELSLPLPDVQMSAVTGATGVLAHRRAADCERGTPQSARRRSGTLEPVIVAVRRGHRAALAYDSRSRSAPDSKPGARIRWHSFSASPVLTPKERKHGSGTGIPWWRLTMTAGICNGRGGELPAQQQPVVRSPTAVIRTAKAGAWPPGRQGWRSAAVAVMPWAQLV